jgi:hypothetical protein
MTVSTDYESDCMQVLKDVQEELAPILDGTTIIKTAQVEIFFQTTKPGALWGEIIKDKTYTAQKNYPVTSEDNLSDTAIIARLEKEISEKSNIQQVLAITKEVIELLSDLQLDKYPNLLALLYDEVKKSLTDEALFALINMYQQISTASLSQENPKKIYAEAFSKLSLESAEAQSLLAIIRNKMLLTSPTELSHETRSYLITVLHLFVEDLENQEKERKKMEETLQLPIDSEKVTQLIAPVYNKILEENKKVEASKLHRCFRDAIIHMKVTSGEKQLSSVNVKLLYVNRSSPYQDLVYEKKFPNRSLELQRPA